MKQRLAVSAFSRPAQDMPEAVSFPDRITGALMVTAYSSEPSPLFSVAPRHQECWVPSALSYMVWNLVPLAAS